MLTLTPIRDPTSVGLSSVSRAFLPQNIGLVSLSPASWRWKLWLPKSLSCSSPRGFCMVDLIANTHVRPIWAISGRRYGGTLLIFWGLWVVMPHRTWPDQSFSCSSISKRNVSPNINGRWLNTTALAKLFTLLAAVLQGDNTTCVPCLSWKRIIFQGDHRSNQTRFIKKLVKSRLLERYILTNFYHSEVKKLRWQISLFIIVWFDWFQIYAATIGDVRWKGTKYRGHHSKIQGSMHLYQESPVDIKRQRFF